MSIANGARTATHDTNFYKNTQSTNDVLWLTAEGPTGMTDETVVYFRPDASGGYDQPFDCQKLWGSENALQLYSNTSDNVQLAVNAMSFGGVNTVVPIGFTIFTSNASGIYSMTATKFESFRTGTSITLEDLKAQKTQELTVNPVYNFTYTDGDNPARFLLHFNNPFFGINDQVTNKDLQIYSYGHVVYLKDLTGKPGKGEMFVFSMIGQEIAHYPVADIQLNKYNFNLPNGYYIVRVISKDALYTGKIYLN